MRYKIGRIIIDDDDRHWETLEETEYLYQAKYRLEEIITRHALDRQFIRSLKLMEGEREIGHVVMAPTLIIRD